MEKLVVMGGVGEDEMKGKHVLLTTVLNPLLVRRGGEESQAISCASCK